MAFAVVTRESYESNLRGLGLPDEVVNAVVSIQENFAHGAFDIVTGDVERLSGKPPRGLVDVLREALGGSR